MSGSGYDVAVAGASIGGCTAARLYGQAGLRVALIEKRPALEAYKTVCTHYIQASAMPVIDRLGLTTRLEARGAMRYPIDLWTPTSGWVRAGDGHPDGINVTRRTLDPMLRSLAAETPGVDLLAGETVVALAGGERPTGVVVEDRTRARREIRARLVVGADGRGSAIARLAGIPGRLRPHNRFFYWGYYRGVRPVNGRSRMWLADPDCAYTFPSEDGLTLVLVAPHRDRVPEFRDDLEGAFAGTLASLPDGPNLSGAEREGKLRGKLDVPNVWRPAAQPGLALVGDAAQASDPLWGVGCGWAFQSAEWLANDTAAPLRDGGDVDTALGRYRRRHLRRLGPHHLMMTDFASGRPANPFERMLYRAAGRDERVREAVGAVGSRRSSPALVLRPDVLARVVRSGVSR